jgi:DNA-binding CsgD family transcriptional regulator
MSDRDSPLSAVRGNQVHQPETTMPIMMPSESAAGGATGATSPALESAPEQRVPFEPAALWCDLMARRARIAASYCTASGCHLEIDRSVSALVAVRPDVCGTLERILLGDLHKVIAFDCACSPSTVTSKALRCLRSIGLDCKVGAVPTALVMLVQATCDRFAVMAPQALSLFSGGGRELFTVRRPNPLVLGVLTDAEQTLVEYLIEGHKRAAIARRRGTSTRTVANQLAQVYRKLGVSGRIRLIRRVAQLNGLVGEIREGRSSGLRLAEPFADSREAKLQARRPVLARKWA